MKYLFIVNPVAGKGEGLNYIQEIKKLFKEEEYYIEVTKRKGHAIEIAKKYSSESDYIIYAVGGDGTVNEVVNGIVGSDSSLVIIPTGSGNDFIRTIDPNYKKKDFLHKLIGGNTTLVDIIKINEKYFLNIASVGLDADIVYNAIAFKKMKLVKGDMAYIFSVAKTIFGKKGIPLKVKLDGKEIWDGKVLLLAIANGKCYGGGIKITPNAEIDDGLADVCLVENSNLLKIFRLLPKLATAKHTESKEVIIYRAKQIEIEGENIFRVNIDGEIVESDRLIMQVIPKAIKLVIPEN
ncbi:diacylglycerol/lipid kinase family protein [Clostridium vincentii]|uniref:Putative lipid kinase BmrU n=1 Tax=Clostridium vincentii TaxID=52704 RepID=A0A2T0BFM0_9CLOT|nr:diacylglycerol kinase family protein [Clostridium vincentii]PRR82690.1 putative lipid kinase BmrU [Clostridium vincentii]